MLQELEVIFDGTALQLESPLNLVAGSRLRIIIENVLPDPQQPKTPMQSTKSLRPIGLCAGEFVVPDDFDAPLSEDILSAFEGQ
jgi:hypothetical protein